MKHGIEKDNLDLNVNPRDDFYHYANGGWMKKNPLKGEYARYGVFDELGEKSRKDLRDLVDTLGEDPEARKEGTVAQKIHDIYTMGLDMERRNREGIKPLMPMLERIESFERKNLSRELAWIGNGISSVFFSVGVGPDAADSDMNILHIGETGLGLGDRDYYLVKSDENDRIMEAYRVYLHDLMTLAGYSEEDACRIRETVLKVETAIAEHKKSREERRDPLLRYNMKSLEEIISEYPGIDWKSYLRESGLPEVEKANISSAGYIKFIQEYIGTLSDREIMDMMAYNAVSSSTGLLTDDFYKVDFELFGKVMSGTEEMRPQWKRSLGIVNSMFGEALGQIYVKKFFPEENKTYMVGLVENLKKALRKHISELTWMSEPTKKRALEKLENIRAKIGYPDKWKDLSELKIDKNRSYLENVSEASVWFIKDNFSKLGKPVDKEEWFMNPQTVNAYYSPAMNEICFPAAILQPPFFDITADDAQNYGAIGCVIGHEMTHGFDDSGRRYDLKGNLCNWWTEEDEKEFTKLTDILEQQFNKVEVAPGVHANGKFTLGENIADQGGLRLAMTAYMDFSTGATATDIDGFSPAQRFYLAYANVWAGNIRDEEILQCTLQDPHSLALNRVNVTLRNINPFIEAFGIKEGDGMFIPENERVVIW